MFKLIVARDNNHGIGYENTIQWKNKMDLKFFKEKTLNGVVVMGRKTFQSIGKPLSNRINIILSKIMIFEHYENTFTFSDINEAIKFIKKEYSDKDWWVIGGKTIYDEFINRRLINEAYVSEINENHLSDTVFNYFSECDDNEYTKDFDLFDMPLLSDSLIINHYKNRNEEEETLLYTMGEIIENGFYKKNRTGVNTYSLFGKMFEYKIDKLVKDNKILYSIPLLTSKKMFLRGVFEELKWFLNGGTDSKVLESKKVNIWKGNTTREYLDNKGLKTYNEGECGPIYGFQWKHWGADYKSGKHNYENEGIDQVTNVIKSLKEDPYSRRHIISGWNVNDLDKMCLPPCFIKNTNVLTDNGYKYIQDVNESDKLYTHKGLFQNIINIQSKNYNKEIYKIKSSNNIKCIETTEEHPFLVSEIQRINFHPKKFIFTEPKWVAAKDLNKDIHYLCIPKNKKSQYPQITVNINNKDVCRRVVTDESTYFMLGMYLIKGFCLKNEDTIISPEWSLFSEFNSENTKACTIPYWIYDLPKECIIQFLKGCCTNLINKSDNKINLYCKYEEVALGLQLLFSKVDIHVKITVDENYNYNLSEIDMGDFQYLNTNYCYFNIENIEKYNYNDTVYNFEVENDNSYTVENIAVHNCHVLYQFLVHEEDNNKYLTLMMTQRSCDTFLGLPFNIASLGLFLISMAQNVNMVPYKIIHSIADMHIYENHIEQVKEQINRDPFPFPYIYIPQKENLLEELNYEDIELYYYNSYGSIKADMAA